MKLARLDIIPLAAIAVGAAATTITTTAIVQRNFMAHEHDGSRHVHVAGPNAVIHEHDGSRHMHMARGSSVVHEEGDGQHAHAGEGDRPEGGEVRVSVRVMGAEEVASVTVEPTAEPQGGHRVYRPHDRNRSDERAPLIYVDGVRMVGEGVLDSIKPDRIERIEVIKGEAAVTLYGPEAEHGVIQIFLKEGERLPGR